MVGVMAAEMVVGVEVAAVTILVADLHLKRRGLPRFFRLKMDELRFVIQHIFYVVDKHAL